MHAPIITGHDHFKAPELPEALEFDLGPGDAELVARCASAVSALRPQHTRDSLTKEHEAAGFEFVGDVV
ncbi:hypothetical protein ACQKIE_16220 [Luteibacter sp. NPDC031894]|uniref:hypothetical protein n=1 Tax=Luteibacter sp. NPDC031894 TaxID=3390572 RepID=UPI003CFDD05C